MPTFGSSPNRPNILVVSASVSMNISWNQRLSEHGMNAIPIKTAFPKNQVVTTFGFEEISHKVAERVKKSDGVVITGSTVPIDSRIRKGRTDLTRYPLNDQRDQNTDSLVWSWVRYAAAQYAITYEKPAIFSCDGAHFAASYHDIPIEPSSLMHHDTSHDIYILPGTWLYNIGARMVLPRQENNHVLKGVSSTHPLTWDKDTTQKRVDEGLVRVLATDCENYPAMIELLSPKKTSAVAYALCILDHPEGNSSTNKDGDFTSSAAEQTIPNKFFSEVLKVFRVMCTAECVKPHRG